MREQRNRTSGPPSGRNYHPGYVVEEEDDYEEDPPPIDDTEYGYDAASASVDDEDPDQTDPPEEYHTIPPEGILDAQGYWWTSSEEHLAEQDACLAQDDEEYSDALVTFLQAKEALRHARVAREFYPVVVPSSIFVKTRSKGKGKGKRKGKAKSKGKPAAVVVDPKEDDPKEDDPLVNLEKAPLLTDSQPLREPHHLLPWIETHLTQRQSEEISPVIGVQTWPFFF